MAALSSASSLSRRLSNFRLSYSVLRCVATNSNLSENQAHSTDSGTGLAKQRDPLAVLKALSRTVKPTPLAPPKEFFEDLILYPKSLQKKKECKAAQESGFKAAEFVLQKYPQLFPMRNPEPAWEQVEESGVLQSEADLKAVISEMNPQDAIKGYEKLISEGVAVSLETKNELLDLVGYYGTVAADDLESHLNDSETTSSSDSSSSDSDENTSLDDPSLLSEEEEESTAATKHKNTWRMNNYAEKLFSSMKEKNARTYDAMILALLKHNYPERAFDFFKEMREENFQASIITYNALLKKIPRVRGKYVNIWKKVKEIIGHMKTDPVVLPTLGTYHVLLKLCVLMPNGSETSLEIFRDMKHKGIEPTLGTYNLLLRAGYYWKMYRKSDEDQDVASLPNNGLLQAVISQLECYDKLPRLQDVTDVGFFNTAIGAAMSCKDHNAAHRLYALAEVNDTAFLGEKRGIFYGSFLAILAQSELSAEVVYHTYKEIVPAKVVPYTWVYAELFKMVARELKPRLVPKLYQDMKKFRVPISETVCKGIFASLHKRTSAKNYRQYVEILEDVFFWMKKFNIPVHAYMISALIKQYCAGGHLKQAWNVLKMYDEHNFVPLYTALLSLLHCCGMNRDIKGSVRVFELIAKYGYSFPIRRKNNFFDNVQMPLHERTYINDILKDAVERDERGDIGPVAKRNQ